MTEKEARFCLNCGKKIKRVDMRQETQCCSRECRKEYTTEKHNCKLCGVEFNRPKRAKKPKTGIYYCSRECSLKDVSSYTTTKEKVECKCEICGTITLRYPSLRHIKYCSKECRLNGLSDIMFNGGAKTKYGIQIREKRGKTFEHTIIVEEFLGENLRNTGAVIIHLDGDYNNNDIDNLYLFRSESEFWVSEKSMSHPNRSNIRDIKKQKASK